MYIIFYGADKHYIAKSHYVIAAICEFYEYSMGNKNSELFSAACAGLTAE